MTSSLSLSNNIAPSNINNSNNNNSIKNNKNSSKNKLNANMATSTTASSNTTNKMFIKKSDLVKEVREVIQKKPESDILKVLEYYENDVAKTIQAFLDDDGKEALKLWTEIKQARKSQTKQTTNVENSNNTNLNGSSETNTNTNNNNNNNNNNNKLNNQPPKRNTDDSNSKKDNNNNISNKQRSNNRPNLNALVSSIINQYTAATPETDNSKTASASSTNSTYEIKPTILQVQQPHNQHQSDLLENLNNLVNSSLPKALGDLKVKVLGIDQPTSLNTNKITTTSAVSPVISSVTSSPSSMSVTSALSLSSASTTDKQLRPTLLDLNKNVNQMNQFNAQRQFNKSYVNPNAKNFLEKPNKDLQRQTVALNKITTQFQDDLTKSQSLLTKTFNDLRKLLNERQNQLQAELNNLAQNGNKILVQRQNKAAELKHLTDNSVHLDDNELLELRADIKHFISERQLDEEFTHIKCFQDENLDKLCMSVSSIGRVAQLNNKYATERPPLNEVLNSASPTPSNQQLTSQIKPNQQQLNKNGANLNSKHQQSNNNLANTSYINTNGVNSNHIDDDEGEFIEVKRPQRNRNKQQQQQLQPQIQQALVNGQINGRPYTNGSVKLQNGTVNNTSNNKKPQKNGDYITYNRNNRTIQNGY